MANGLRLVHRSFPSEVSYCGIVLNTGARDEYPDEYGMAHFVEHMLFKGTKRRKAHHIANRMENVGGDLNAYTTKEETFIYATFLEEYFPRAVELLSDIIFNSQFSEQQIDRERMVVLDEISSYDDIPGDLIFDDFENMMFQGHEIGHNILGDPESLISFERDNLISFVKRQYQPSEMLFFSFGRKPFSQVLKLVESGFSASGNGLIKKKRSSPKTLVPHSKIVDKKTSQSHLIMGWSSFSMYHSDRYALSLLNSILGGGNMNSRLNRSLREKNGLVYNVESNLTLYTDTGLFTLYFASDPKQREKCVKLILKEIRKMMEVKLTPMQLAMAKRQWKGQFGIALENSENSLLSMAKTYLHYDRFIQTEEIFSNVDQVTSQQIRDVANRLFSTPPFELTYL